MADAVSPLAPNSASPDAAPRRILIVEDDAPLRELVRRILIRAGHNALAIGSVSGARECLRAQSFDLLLLDHTLPDGTAGNIVDTVQGLGLTTPFIVTTGQGDEQLVVSMMKRGAADYLVKDPTFLDLLPEVVGRCLAQAESSARLEVAQARASEAERRLLRLMASLPGMAYRCQPFPPWQMEIASAGALALTGYSSDELCDGSLPVQHLIHPDDQAAVAASVETALAACRPFALEYRLRHRDGSIRWVSERGQFVPGSHGEPIALEGFIWDATEQRTARAERERLLAELHESQRLAAIGRLAGGVAHEINNPVMGIANYAELVAERAADPQAVATLSAEIQRECARVADVVRTLLGLARPASAESSPCPVSELIQGALQLVRASMLQRGIRVRIDIEENLPPVPCVAPEITRMLLNLLANAADALGDGPALGGDESAIDIAAHGFTRDGNRWLRLTVSDHGCGMTEERLEHAFDPFYTTKNRAENAGLGLAVSRGIVSRHGGRIRIESAPGAGTHVHVELPQNSPKEGAVA